MCSRALVIVYAIFSQKSTPILIFFDTPIPSPRIMSFLLRIYLYHITSRLITKYNLLYIFNIVITFPLSGKPLTGVHNFRQTILRLFLFIIQIQKLTPYSCIYLPIHIIYHYYFLIPIYESAVMKNCLISFYYTII